MKTKSSTSEMIQQLCAAAIEDLTQIKTIEIEEPPAWWISKLGIASAYLNSLRDYAMYNSEKDEDDYEEEDKESSYTPQNSSVGISMLPPSARL